MVLQIENYTIPSDRLHNIKAEIILNYTTLLKNCTIELSQQSIETQTVQYRVFKVLIRGIHYTHIHYADCRVYLINEDQWIFSLHLLKALDHLSWHGTHIGPPGVGGEGTAQLQKYKYNYQMSW